MSEMFTKCNGFIVSGEPLVYADSATMTGQGTVSEPFGVKSTDLFVQEPLYTGTSGNSAYIGCNINETVLYSGQSTGNLTLSDSPLNYERLLITFNASTGTTDMGAGSEIFEPDKTHLVCLHNYFMYQTTQTAFNNMNEAWAVYTGVDTTAWARTIGGWRNGSTYTSNLNAGNDFLKISKVVGINRKV